MTLEEIRSKFKSGELSAQQALQELTPHLMGRTKRKAESVVNEILAMPEEPADTSEMDAQIARGWYKDE